MFVCGGSGGVGTNSCMNTMECNAAVRGQGLGEQQHRAILKIVLNKEREREIMRSVIHYHLYNFLDKTTTFYKNKLQTEG